MDLDEYSTDDLLRMYAQATAGSEPARAPERSTLSIMGEAISEIPRDVAMLPKGIYSIGSDVVKSATGDTEAMGRTAETGTRMGASIGGAALGGKGGALLGAPLAPFTFGLSVPVAAAGGALVGGTAGYLGGDSLVRWLKGEDQMTSEDLSTEGIKDLTKGAVFLGAGGALKQAARGTNKLTTAIARQADPFTEAGQRRIAGRLSSELLDKLDESTKQQIRAGNLTAEGAGGVPKSIAEQITGKDATRLAQAEAALSRGFPETAGEAAALRQYKRLNASLEGIGDVADMPAGAYGETIVEGLAKKKAAAGKAVSKQYKALKGDSVVPLNGAVIENKLVDLMDDYLGRGQLDSMNPQLQQITLDLIDQSAGGSLTLDQVKNYRRTAKNIGMQQGANPVDRGFGKAIAGILDDAEKSAGGELGKAVKARAEMGRTYEQSVAGDILKRGKYNREVTDPAGVYNKVTKSKKTAKEFVKATDSNMIELTQNKILSEVADDLRTAAGELDLSVRSRVNKNLNSHKGKLEAYKEILSPEQYRRVELVLDEAQGKIRMDKLTKARSSGGSPTDQFGQDVRATRRAIEEAGSPMVATVIKQVPESAALALGAVGGFYGSGGAAAAPAAIGAYVVANKVKRSLLAAEDNIARIAYETLTDPELARQVLTQAEKGSARALAITDRINREAAGISVAGRASIEAGRITEQEPVANELDSYSTDELIKMYVGAINMDKAPKLPAKEVKTEAPKKQEPREDLVIDRVLQQVEANPVDWSIMMMESGGDPKAKNPESSASGLFQLINSTAKNLGVKDPFDPEQNYNAYLKLKADTVRQFGSDDVETIYSSHYLGAPTLKRWREGKPLNAKQQAQVNYLQSELLPRLRRFYNQYTNKQEMI